MLIEVTGEKLEGKGDGGESFRHPPCLTPLQKNPINLLTSLKI